MYRNRESVETGGDREKGPPGAESRPSLRGALLVAHAPYFEARTAVTGRLSELEAG
jgi:hypothetical protein